MLKPRWEEVVKPHNRLPYLKNVSVLSSQREVAKTARLMVFKLIMATSKEDLASAAGRKSVACGG
jgi:hypothetical protein